MIKNCFTVDVEDGISIAMRDFFGKKICQTDRVVYNTKYILDLLEERNIKGTFFCLGKVAKKFPFLIKEIAKNNHELGVHGYSHTQYFKMKRKEIISEIERSKKLIQDISGCDVYGHRAPAFSIDKKNSWILEVLVDLGFVYDSSIVPCKTSRYGWNSFPENICNLSINKTKNIIEVPISVGNFFSKKIPVLWRRLYEINAY